MNKLFIINFFRYFFGVLLLLWCVFSIIIFGLGYQVTKFNPEDDLIELIEQSENKMDWEINFENNEKTRRFSFRVLILPTRNNDEFNQSKQNRADE